MARKRRSYKRDRRGRFARGRGAFTPAKVGRVRETRETSRVANALTGEKMHLRRLNAPITKARGGGLIRGAAKRRRSNKRAKAIAFDKILRDPRTGSVVAHNLAAQDRVDRIIRGL